MHEMRTIAIAVPGVCQSVCLSRFCFANKAIRIEVLLGVENLGAEETLYYMGVPIHRREGEGGIDTAIAKLLSSLVRSACDDLKKHHSV